MQTRGFTLLVVVLAVSGGVLVYTQVFPYGAHLNTDSFSYLSAARSLLSGEGYLIFGGSGKTDLWPPIYPALLALASLVSGMDPLAVIDPFNAIIFGLTVLVLGRWLNWRLEHRPLMVWACLAALFIEPVVWVATHARSESLFILFTTLALSSADRFLKMSGGGSHLLAAAVWTALACLTRYAGVTIVAAVAPLLLLQRSYGLRARFVHTAMYAVVSVAPFAAWLVRNLVTTGNLAGPRAPSTVSLWENLGRLLANISEWPPVWILLTMAAGYVFVRWVRQEDAGMAIGFRPSVVGAFTFVFFDFMFWTTTTVAIDRLDQRLLSPAFIPLLVCSALAVDRWWSSYRDGLRSSRQTAGLLGQLRMGWWPAIGVAVLLSAYVMAEGSHMVYKSLLKSGRPASIATRQGMLESPTFQYLRGHRPLDFVVSNANKPWFHGGADISSGTEVVRLPKRKQDQFALLRRADTVVWFHDLFRGRLDNTLPWLRGLSILEKVAELDDGVVFQVLADHRSEAYALPRGHPIIRGDFDVYLEETALTYIAEPCPRSVTMPRFFFHLYPVDRNDLPPERQDHGFDTLGFPFDRYGVWLNDKCLVRRPLPNYEIASIRTGQYISGEGRIWEGSFDFAEPAGDEESSQ